MPDITMCKSENCDMQNKCYRYTAKPDRLQSYADFSAFKKSNKCEFFWNDERIEE